VQYQPGDAVTLWLSKVGPYHNPQEVYAYYALPFCRPDSGKLTPETRIGGLGEILEGSELQNSDIPIKFMGARPDLAGWGALSSSFLAVSLQRT
jgi:hypothetical protein